MMMLAEHAKLIYNNQNYVAVLHLERTTERIYGTGGDGAKTTNTNKRVSFIVRANSRALARGKEMAKDCIGLTKLAI